MRFVGVRRLARKHTETYFSRFVGTWQSSSLSVGAAISSKKIRSQDKRNEECAMSEERKPSQRQGRELRDQQLLACMKEDFDAGFGKVVEDYWHELYNWACKLLEGSGLTHLAEDAVQEGLFSAYKDLRHHRQKLDTLHLQHWLYAIVRQKSIECLTQGNKTIYLAGLLGWENEGEDIAAGRSADAVYNPAYRLERWETISEARRTVTELLKSLSDTQREVILLKNILLKMVTGLKRYPISR